MNTYIEAFLIWFNDHSYVGIDVFIMVFKVLIPSTVGAYILWKKVKSFRKKSDSNIQNQYPNISTGQKLLNIAFIGCTYISVLSWIALIIFIFLALGL